MNPLSGISYGAELTSAANRYHLDPTLLAAVAAQETGGPGATSGRNIVGDGGHGHGLLQIDDRWHAFASTPAAMDPQANANYAAGLLSSLLQQYGGNVKAALSAYNAGSPNATGTVTDWGNGQSLGYADSVMRHYADISNFEGASGGAVLAAGSPFAVGSSATLGSTAATSGLGTLLGDAATVGAAGTGSSADQSALEMMMLEQSMPTAQQPSSPTISFTQLSGAAAQIGSQADQLSSGFADQSDDGPDQA